MIRHAIIGTGFGAAVHLPAFAAAKSIEVVALCDSGSGRAVSLAPAGVKPYHDWRQMLDKVRPDSVSIVVPPTYQKEIGLEVCRRGIHMLCEKPVGTNFEHCLELAQMAKFAHVVGAVGFQFRYEVGVRHLRSLVKSGDIGKLKRVDINWFTSGRANPERPWSWQHDSSQGGGVVLAFLTHVLDMMTWISGRPITGISGQNQIWIPQRPGPQGGCLPVTAEDCVDVLVNMEGVAGAAKVSNCQSNGPGLCIEAYGSNGWIKFSHAWPYAPENASLVVNIHSSKSVDLGAVTDSDAYDTRTGAASKLVQDYCQAIQSNHKSEERDKEANLPRLSDALSVHNALTFMRKGSLIKVEV